MALVARHEAAVVIGNTLGRAYQFLVFATIRFAGFEVASAERFQQLPLAKEVAKTTKRVLLGGADEARLLWAALLADLPIASLASPNNGDRHVGALEPALRLVGDAVAAAHVADLGRAAAIAAAPAAILDGLILAARQTRVVERNRQIRANVTYRF